MSVAVAAPLAFLVAAVWAPAICGAQEVQNTDTHRVTLRNGNMLDGVLRDKSDQGVLLQYSPSVRMFIRWGEIKSVEIITIRTLRAPMARIEPPAPKPGAGAGPATPREPPPKDRVSTRVKLPDIPKDLQQRIDDLLDLVRATQVERRGRFAEMLDSLGPEARRYMAVRLEMLPDDLVRWVASEIGRSQDQSLVLELRQRLNSDRAVVRSVAIQLLLELHDAASAPRFARLLTDEDEGVRGAAAIALPEFGDESSLTPLLRLLEDSSVPVRRIGLNAAIDLARRKGKMPDVVSYWKLHVATATAGQREDVASAALLVIPSLGGADDPESTDTRAAMEEILVDLASDREPAVRIAAFRSLGKLGSPRSHETLIAALPAERNDDALIADITAINELRDRDAIPELIERLDSMNAKVRDAAWNALKTITGEMALPAESQAWREWHGRK
jgi:HEAT repeat protein